MKKVVMLNSMSFLQYQGRYLRIHNQAKTLVEAGYEVTLLAWDRNCDCPLYEKMDGINIERIPLAAGMAKGPLSIHKHILFNLQLIFKLWNRPVDIIHCFNLDSILAGLLVAKLRRKKVTLDLCEPEYYSWWSQKQMFLVDIIGYFEKKISPFFDFVFVHNLYQMKKFHSYGISKLRLVSSVPRAEMVLKSIRKRQTSKKKKVVLGRIGTVYPEVGIEETIAAVKKLIEKGVPIKMLFAGKVLEQYEETFLELIAPIKEHLELSGAFDISEMPDLYKKIDLSMNIYQRTPFNKYVTPTKFFESLANGVPVVTSDMGDCKELMEKYPCGILVDEDEPQQICEAIEDLIKDPDKINKMAEAGLNLVKKEYCWPVMAERLLAAYKEMSA